MSEKPERFELSPEGSKIGLDVAFAVYGSNRGSIGVGLFYESFEATRYLTLDDVRELRKWLDSAIAYSETAASKSAA